MHPFFSCSSYLPQEQTVDLWLPLVLMVIQCSGSTILRPWNSSETVYYYTHHFSVVYPFNVIHCPLLPCSESPVKFMEKNRIADRTLCSAVSPGGTFFVTGCSSTISVYNTSRSSPILMAELTEHTVSYLV